MKQTILVLTTMALFAACGGGADTSALGKKRAERDSLKTVYAELGVKIKDIETWLAENDSTVRRNLSTVTSTPVVAGTFAHYVDVHGMVKADRSAALFAQGGRVRSILVKPGDQVRAGQLLISIDNDLVEKQIAQASTAAELARTTFEKQDALWKQKIGSEMQFLQAKAQMEQAQAGLAALHEQQRLTNITSPFEGMVDDIMVRVGDMASPMQPVARVVNLSAVQLEADVPEGYLRSVKAGAPVKVRFPSLNETFDGELDHVGQFIDPANRTFKVTVRVPKAEAYMRPNLLSDISIQNGNNDSALVVPSRTVLQDVAGNNYVYVLDVTRDDEAVARKIMVQRLSEYKGRISVAPVKAGELKGGERVVDEGAKNVTEGTTVRVANN
ncbi:MAG: efflux RND transporter periplasmic adaptor subunit [Flavobacteriales bacterium]|jgi:membrane fusion protein (multidrug efflux system)|nr:efflux RND transporter periplasmic adaptor subunit [Flavobacteriales bacterium]MCC6910704.1 efflux RND transporter periplasmic adaptor subunit [Flavobacteriales bacterium]